MIHAADFPEGNTKDGEYLAKKLEQAIKILEALKMKPLLSYIVTDNAAVMLKANKVLDNEEEYPDGKYGFRAPRVDRIRVRTSFHLLFNSIQLGRRLLSTVSSG